MHNWLVCYKIKKGGYKEENDVTSGGYYDTYHTILLVGERRSQVRGFARHYFRLQHSSKTVTVTSIILLEEETK
jgi:hypothetical protein